MEFTAEHQLFRKTVREVLEREVNPHVDEWEAAGTFPAHEVFPKLGELGLLGLEYDPAYGGQGADHSYKVILGEELKERYLVPAIRGDVVAERTAAYLRERTVSIGGGADEVMLQLLARLDGFTA